MGPLVRFDDIASGTASTLIGFRRAVVAASPDEVVPALIEVEAAVAAGLWAGGYVAYEAAAGIDPELRVRTAVPGDPLAELPLVWFGLFEDRREEDALAARIDRPAPYSVSTWTPSIGRPEYEKAFQAIRRFIAAGDTYQVNHTFRLRAAFAGDAFEMYRDLVLSQRGAYAAYVDLGRHQIVSASPELFLMRDGDVLITKPMKGTSGRGRWPDEDEALAAQLAASEKDRAENLMIVDMLRSDLGRVAEFGTVMVQRLYELERYETVWQLTSTVTGTVPESVGFVDVLRAIFPCGSVTGAPKPRTMELISELEHTSRGVYCGTVGWLAPPGAPGPSCRFNVAIRTVAVDKQEGIAEYGVGGGITWDSQASGEYDEARAKARVLVQRRPEFDLVETMRYEAPEGFAWLDRHLGRLAGSADYFGFSWDSAVVEAALKGAVASLGTGVWRVRLTIDRAGGPDVQVVALEPDDEEPVRLLIDDDSVNSSNVFLFHKTTYRREYEQRVERHIGADDVVMVNERGEATETTAANLAVKIDGEWRTPALDSGCLPGVYRAVLLEEGRVAEGVITPEDLNAAESVAVFNSVRLWRAARLLDPTAAVVGGSGAGGALG